MGLLTAIGSFISSAITTVGPVIASVADFVINKLPPSIEVAKIVMGAITEIVSKVCEALYIAPADENAEELGAKTMQEDTRPKMEGETTQEYLDYLRNDVTLDKEKFDKMSAEEKMACEAIGTTMKAKSIEEKTGVELPPEFLLTIAKSKMRYEQVEKFINAFSQNGIDSMGQFTKYISNNMSKEESIRIGNTIKVAMKELSPELSDEDIRHEISAMKREYNN